MISRLFLLVFLMFAGQLFCMTAGKTVGDLLKNKKGKEHAPEAVTPQVDIELEEIEINNSPDVERARAALALQCATKAVELAQQAVEVAPRSEIVPVHNYGNKLAYQLNSVFTDEDAPERVSATLTQLSLHPNIIEYWGVNNLKIIAIAKTERDYARHYLHYSHLPSGYLPIREIVHNANLNLERIKWLDRKIRERK